MELYPPPPAGRRADLLELLSVVRGAPVEPFVTADHGDGSRQYVGVHHSPAAALTHNLTDPLILLPQEEGHIKQPGLHSWARLRRATLFNSSTRRWTPNMPHPPALRMCQSLPTALLSLAYLTASSTTAFVLGPLRASRVTSASNRQALLPAAAAYRRLTAASQHQQQHQRRCPTSTRLLAGSASSALTPTAPQAGLRKARSSRSGGVRSLKSVAAPAGLEKGVSARGLGELLEARNGVNERFVFFGGKGGVGKTSTAAAVAIQCADAGLR